MNDESKFKFALIFRNRVCLSRIFEVFKKIHSGKFFPGANVNSVTFYITLANVFISQPVMKEFRAHILISGRNQFSNYGRSILRKILKILIFLKSPLSNFIC